MKALASSILVMVACAGAKPAVDGSSPPFAGAAGRAQVPAGDVAALAGRRAHLIQWLHEYADAGVYPVGPDGMPRSVFRDDQGTLCPMAELIHRSGRDDLVDAVAHDNNALRLADVHAGPLADWMVASGLTRDEIAMVQGALSVDEMRLVHEEPSVRVAAAKAEVRGRLETAETALRDNTAHQLIVIAERAAAAKPVKAPIVPRPRR